MKCPTCGNGHLAYDWVGVTSVHVVDGVVTEVNAGGVLDAVPDRATCMDCGTEFKPTPDEAEGVDLRIRAQLPARLVDDLTNGKGIFTRSESPS